MWLQRLPTWAMRHSRNDHEDGALVSLLCTTCTKNGLHISETMYHIFVECIGSTRCTNLRQKLNNVYRKLNLTRVYYQEGDRPFEGTPSPYPLAT